jgi:uncharacterized protein YjbJ (UPF0337 family)
MAASPKTPKATGSARKATGSARKATGSARKATGSAQKATGSARKATGSAQKATGSARKASSSSKKTTGSARKANSSSKKTTGSARKANSSSGKAAGSAQKARGSSRKATTSKPQKGIYVYGILPADIELTSEMPGVGDPPGQVRVIRSDGLAALVSDVDASMPLGSPEDLTAHQQIVDASAAAVPVLPARFGAVMESEEEVTEDLLGANHDEFDDALKELDGRAQYVVKGRYVEKVILQEVLSENRQAAHLADKLRDADPDATRDARIKLGEIVNEAVAAKRHKDTNALGHAMDGHCVASVVREPTHELDAVHVAFLVETDGEGEMEQAIEDLARDWEGRIEVRLLGPMAAYDFVGSALPEG